jgi:hypothetical protein
MATRKAGPVTGTCIEASGLDERVQLVDLKSKLWLDTSFGWNFGCGAVHFSGIDLKLSR